MLMFKLAIINKYFFCSFFVLSIPTAFGYKNTIRKLKRQSCRFENLKTAPRESGQLEELQTSTSGKEDLQLSRKYWGRNGWILDIWWISASVTAVSTCSQYCVLRTRLFEAVPPCTVGAGIPHDLPDIVWWASLHWYWVSWLGPFEVYPLCAVMCGG